MKGQIRTVRGDIDPGELGATDAHEHLLIRNDLILVKVPAFRLDSVECAEREAADFKKHGGGAIVDAAPIGIGRDPDGLLRVSQTADVHVIAATGFHKSSYYLDSHWRHYYSVDEIAKLFADEVELGMEQTGYAGPLTRRSQARAGVIKAASDYQSICASDRKGFEAAALCHQMTGAPILTHSEIGTMALDQVRLLQSLGVRPEHVVVSHVDRNPDPYIHRELASTGAFLEYDGAGRVKYFPESVMIELIRKLFECDLGGQILLGGDMARRSYWKAYGGGPGIAYLMERFLPRLRNDGFCERQIQMLYCGNAARAFQFRLD